LTINSNLISLTKIHAYSDDIDERAKLSKQTLPEFLFDYYLNLFGEPQLAEEALVIIVSNVRTYDTTSPRAWMFSRFLRFLFMPACVRACVRACVHMLELCVCTCWLLLRFDVLHLELQSWRTAVTDRGAQYIPGKSGAAAKRPDSSSPQLRRLECK